jgi:thiol:disulfide interchange protein DsbG
MMYGREIMQTASTSTAPFLARLRSRGLRPAIAVVLAALAASAAGAKTPAPRDLPALYAALEKTDAVSEGAISPGRILYVFFDANCWFCHLTWKALQPYEKAGLQVRWVPVAYQKESSATRAAAIMQAKDRAAALRENETRYRAKTYDGGIGPAKNVPPELAAQLEGKDEKGRVRVRIGMPRLSRLPSITGLPAQKNDDPDLKDFR